MNAGGNLEVAVGLKLPIIRHVVTQAMINRYAEASGDDNPLHIDPEFGKTTPFGGTIAHGMMTLAFMAQMMAEWDWVGWSCGGELDIAFIGPVRPGEEVVTSGTVREIENRNGARYAACDVTCAAGGRTVLAGTAWRRLGNPT